ncbi:TPA: hypothetical protein ENS27_18255 [bacterium]|nr:hypothetical protein [bacterium]
MRKRIQSEERTSFQEAGDYDPIIDSRADVAMVYGINQTFENRVRHWQEAGYRVHVMTGIAWGGYEDYVRGEWDGVKHYDDAQTAIGDFKLEHGISQGHDIFYMMPSMTYARYLGEKLRRVVDAGALAIHLEEPEFWVRAGYSDGFKREWLDFYGEEWQDPTSSPDARYRCEKLKQYLYTRTIEYLCNELKKYAKEKGNPNFKCYVPTHSLINYAHWRIVSPESKMLALSQCDGLIGQVWTGTSRTPTVYAGIRKQRTFEAGYCEYSACGALVRNSNKMLWQLADPIEDNPNYCWEDYRINWECTVTASLLVKESDRFEIMPWPSRIFRGTYPTVNLNSLPLKSLLEKYLERLEKEGRQSLYEQTQCAFRLMLDLSHKNDEPNKRENIGFADLADISSELRFGDLGGMIHSFYKHLSTWEDQQDAQKMRDAVASFYHNPTDQRSSIPEDYATELQIVFNALADMSWAGEYEWIFGQTGVGLAISDTLMFQRGEPNPSDDDMSSLYGLALPLIKHGTALEMVQIERITCSGYLEDLKVLLLTYEGQKPPEAIIHEELAKWVKNGHVLVLFGNGDSYNDVREWWNQDATDYNSPQDHLTELLGLGRNPSDGEYNCGKGWVIIDSSSPANFAHDPKGWINVIAQTKKAYQLLNLSWSESPALAFRRGPYVISAGMDEVDYLEPKILSGNFVNLFDAKLAVISDPIINADSRWLLYDLAYCPDYPCVIASAGCLRNELFDKHSLTFAVESIEKTICAIRAKLPEKPHKLSLKHACNITEQITSDWEWDEKSQTVLLRFYGNPKGTLVEFIW